MTKEKILEFFKDIDSAYNNCNMLESLSRMLDELTEGQRWIPVSERFPEDDEDVLVWVNGTHRDMAYRDEGVWYDEEHNHLKNITHWMPLPKPPKDGEQE